MGSRWSVKIALDLVNILHENGRCDIRDRQLRCEGLSDSKDLTV